MTKVRVGVVAAPHLPALVGVGSGAVAVVAAAVKLRALAVEAARKVGKEKHLPAQVEGPAEFKTSLCPEANQLGIYSPAR